MNKEKKQGDDDKDDEEVKADEVEEEINTNLTLTRHELRLLFFN